MSDEEEMAAGSRRRRQRRWIGVLVVVALLLALALTPPLLNANRLAHRIATSMSQSLGRPVHLDNVTLHALPVPGLTLENLVISEDPSFGAEPVIRANKVTARLRLSSLWRRQVEFSTISFEVDEHGSGPSVNLVRRADGRWNMESILMNASQQNAAPTAQTTASAVPRFPYIEATGARLNVKLGDEKEPLALTEADFALWLPSPRQWRLRLVGKPARTDTSVSDTGILNLEATLQHADRLADVPVEITASWRRAPLGEASRLLSGGDAGWRGNLEVTANALGTLGDAKVTSHVKLTDVRRADFIPAKMMRVNVECQGRLAVMTARVREPSCTLPLTEDSTDEQQSVIAATADGLDLAGLQAGGLRIGMSNVPDGWVLDWARLFSQRIPAEEKPTGIVSGSMAKGDAGWEGELHDAFQVADWRGATLPKDGRSEARTLSLMPSADGLLVAPLNIAPVDNPPLLLSGTATRRGYSLQLAGSASEDEWKTLRTMLPPLGDGLEEALPVAAGAGSGFAKMDVTCTRSWGAPQSCVTNRVVDVVKKKPKRRR